MKTWISLLVFSAFLGCKEAAQKPTPTPLPQIPAPPRAEKPKNIILLIGDGTALAQASALVYWVKGGSVIEKMPVVGFHKQHSSDDLITDSAAGATAFACGIKTGNGMIGVNPDNKPCRTILEDLDANGWATGMVVTCSAPHATPASFIAHREIRAFTDEIAEDYLKTDLDCFIGGGEGYFNDRVDDRNLIDSLENRGYVVRSGTNFKKLPLDGSAPFYNFMAPREPATAGDGRRYLPEAARLACDFLKKRSKKGFFLMVEASQIDWALHANNRDYLRSELLDFEKTLQNLLAFAAADGETLLIVTGDHECGGLSLGVGHTDKSFEPEFATKLHTGTLVPVYAFGPKAPLFSGVYQNTAIFFKMNEALGR